MSAGPEAHRMKRSYFQGPRCDYAAWLRHRCRERQARYRNRNREKLRLAQQARRDAKRVGCSINATDLKEGAQTL